MSEWIKCSERMPDIPSEPSCGNCTNVIAWRSGWKEPRQMVWRSNIYAKTEKGRTPRWEEMHGCLAFSEPTHWREMPEPPKD